MPQLQLKSVSLSESRWQCEPGYVHTYSARVPIPDKLEKYSNANTLMQAV
jgi:hypothetical protein